MGKEKVPWEDGWDHVREGLEVKICEGPGVEEVFLLCRSEERRRKELAMHERFSARIVEAREAEETTGTSEKTC